MRKMQSLAFFSTLILLFFTACRSDVLVSEDALVYIPDNVATVTAFNMGRLMEKADFESLKSMEFYQDIVEKVGEENAAFAQVLENPDRAGIDLDQNVYMSVELDSGEEPGFVAVLFSIKDKAAFERTLDGLDLQYVPATQEPGYLQEHRTAMIWEDEIGILGISEMDEVQAKAKAYLNTQEERSIRNNKNLRKALTKDFEILNWMSSAAFVNMFDLKEVAKFGRFSEEDLKDNYVHSSMHFENGRMRAKTEFFLQRKISNDLALIFKNKVKTDFSTKVPHEGLFFFSNLAINPKGINQLLIEYHIKGMSDQPLQQFGIEFDDLIKAFNGDGAIGLYQGDGDILNLPGFLMALKIDSRKHLDRLLSAAQDAGVLRQLGDDRYQMINRYAGDNEVADEAQLVEAEMLIKNGLLYLSDGEKRIDLIASDNYATDSDLPKRMASLIAKNAFAFIMDMETLSKMDDDFENIPITSVDASAGRNGGEATFHLNNAKDNSLKQLFQWMEDQYLQEKERKETDEEDKS